MSWTKLMFECKTSWGRLWLVQVPLGWPWALPTWWLCCPGSSQGSWDRPCPQDVSRSLSHAQLSDGATARPCLCAKQAAVWSINVFCSHSSGTKLAVSPQGGAELLCCPRGSHSPWIAGKASVGCGKGLGVCGVTSGAPQSSFPGCGCGWGEPLRPLVLHSLGCATP